MSASLVGSEMCIRDRCSASAVVEQLQARPLVQLLAQAQVQPQGQQLPRACLLYTSDAADDM
eukprot:3182518-Alexandrium_andersonii.AAC.1